MFPQPNIPQEVLTWDDIDKLIGHLMPQFNHEYDDLIMITRGGLIPGGILCEAMGIKNVHTAAVHLEESDYNENLSWPTFMQFPNDSLIAGKRLLVINDIWAGGRVMELVKSRLAAGALVETAVLHFRSKSNRYSDTGPDYYGAITNNYIIYPWESPHPFSTGYLKSPQLRPPQLD